MAMRGKVSGSKIDEGHQTEKGTIVSVTVVGIFILFVYLVMFGFYMSRV
jgi:hypothetical protein